MRRNAVVVFAVVAVAAAALAGSGVVAAGESGPKCADITGENHNYATRGTINFGLILAGASDAVSSVPCKSVTYTLVISGISGSPLVVQQKGNNLFANVHVQRCRTTTSASRPRRAPPAARCTTPHLTWAVSRSRSARPGERAASTSEPRWGQDGGLARARREPARRPRIAKGRRPRARVISKPGEPLPAAGRGRRRLLRVAAAAEKSLVRRPMTASVS